jgi:amidase
MTDTVANNALFLEVIAGPDGFDPRQEGAEPDAYSEALNGDVTGLKIGVLEEGFGHFNSEAEVNQKVKDAAGLFEKLGCQVSRVSIPIHRQCMAIWAPIGIEGTHDALTQGGGYGAHGTGVYVPSLMKASAAWRDHANEISDTMKYVLILGRYISKTYGRYFYGKAQNLSRLLRASYDEVLGFYDLLLMPTVPMIATPIPSADASTALRIKRAHDNFANPPAFDVTGHPALSIPCGLSNELPVGMMLVGKHYDEASIYKAAFTFEQAEDWRQK